MVRVSTWLGVPTVVGQTRVCPSSDKDPTLECRNDGSPRLSDDCRRHNSKSFSLSGCRYPWACQFNPNNYFLYTRSSYYMKRCDDGYGDQHGNGKKTFSGKATYRRGHTNRYVNRKKSMLSRSPKWSSRSATNFTRTYFRTWKSNQVRCGKNYA